MGCFYPIHRFECGHDERGDASHGAGCPRRKGDKCDAPARSLNVKGNCVTCRRRESMGAKVNDRDQSTSTTQVAQGRHR